MALARAMSEEKILEKTGKPSSDWNKIIDKFGSKNHTEIAKSLREKYKVGPWWAQVLTNRWEWGKGLRTK